MTRSLNGGRLCLSGLPATLVKYPEIAIFLALAIGYYFGKFTFKGIGLGAVTSTLLAGVLIGQIGITISQPLKAFVFLMFLFAVGYARRAAVRPRHRQGRRAPGAVRGGAVRVLPGRAPSSIAKIAGYDLGYAAGLYSGSQTISASMGLATDAINRLGLPRRAGQGPARLDADRLRRDLHVRHRRLGDHHRAARARSCSASIWSRRARTTRRGRVAARSSGGAGSAWHRWELRAFRVQPAGARWACGPPRRKRWCPMRASSC